MYVLVTFLGLHRARAQTNQIQVPLASGARVADLFAHIKQSYPTIPLPENGTLVAVNDKLSSMERVLENRDNVTFIPFLGGG